MLRPPHSLQANVHSIEHTHVLPPPHSSYSDPVLLEPNLPGPRITSLEVSQVILNAIKEAHVQDTADPAQLTSLIISALSRHKNPHPLCSFGWCQQHHDPTLCCICFGSNHSPARYWILNGLPDSRRDLLDCAKAAKQNNLPSFANNGIEISRAVRSSPHSSGSGSSRNVSHMQAQDTSAVAPTLPPANSADLDATQYAIDDTHNAYQSPWLSRDLSISALQTDITSPNVPDLSPPLLAPSFGDSDDQPDSTKVITYPPPSLPHDRIPSVTSDLELCAGLRPDESLTHVDTGAYGYVPCIAGELHNLLPESVSHFVGTLVMNVISADRTLLLDLTLPHTVEMPHYCRCSLSCHGLKRLGYEADHRLCADGNVLWVRTPNGKEYSFKLLTLDEADYPTVKIILPSPSISISALDVAKTMGPTSLYHLIHLCLGCPGLQAMELFLNGRSVLGLPSNIPIPDTFSCPVCMREKQPSLAHGPSRESPLKVLGEMLHMDFGFYKIRSCCAFTCFLVITEGVSRHLMDVLSTN